MNKPITYYHLVLDRSGSMGSCWSSALRALGNQYEQIQSTKAKLPDQEMMYSYCIFNEALRMSEGIAPVTNNLQLPDSVFPDGLTALHDAVGSSIDFIQKYAGREIEANDHADVVMIIITDGAENASRHFSGREIKRMIQRLEATEKWTFLFIGLDVDIKQVIREYQIAPNASAIFSKDNFEKEYQSVNEKMSSFAISKSLGTKDKITFD